MSTGSVTATTKEEISTIRRQLAHQAADTVKANLLLALCRLYWEKPGEETSDLDSAMLLCGQAKTLSEQLSYPRGIGLSILYAGNIYSEKGDRKKTWGILQAALSHFKRYNLTRESADTYIAMAQYFTNDPDEMVEKVAYYEKALPLYKAVGATGAEAYTLKELADACQYQGDYNKVLPLLERSLKLYQSIGFKDLQGIYNVLCQIYREKGVYTLALRYGLLAIKTGETVGDYSQQMCAIFNHVALTYFDMKDYATAIVYFKKSRTVAADIGDYTSMLVVDTNLADALMALNQADEAIAILDHAEKNYPPKYLAGKVNMAHAFLKAYLSRGAAGAAKKYYEQMLLYYGSMSPADPMMDQVYNAIIPYLQATRQYEKTYPYLENFGVFVAANPTALHKAMYEKLYFKTDSATGRCNHALRHYQQYKAWSDSLFSLEKSKQFTTLQLQYGSERKDHAIDLLTQKSLLQENIIRQQQLVRNVIIGGVVMLIIVLALMYNRNRLKQQSNGLLQRKQEEINEQNALLKNLLREKEWLLKEVHHRVKNNLQIVISLLNTQSAYLVDENAIMAIRNSQNRMYAMSLIHLKLYQSDNMSSVDMSWYTRELVEYMRQSFLLAQQIDFVLDTEHVELDVAQAVPVGLILNEAISNAIKHAFVGRPKGTVWISLRRTGAATCELRVEDNGMGLPVDVNIETSRSLGITLMRGLCQQLDGTFTLHSKAGLSVHIIFNIQTKTPVSEDLIG